MNITTRTTINASLSLRLIGLILLLGATVIAFASSASAQRAPTASRSQAAQKPTVRGKLERKGDTGNYPAAYVRVTLAPSNAKSDLNSVYTGSDGMYYFRNVPPGTYVLKIWGAQDKAIMSFSIKVSNRPYTDLEPIIIP
jgi:hypothetical protein